MYRRLLVPLDGSHLAEAALPAARRLAEKLGASPTLLHVIERDAPERIHHDRHLTAAEEATAYLEDTARRLLPGVSVQTHVHTAAVTDVVGSLLDHSREMEPDLIVLCTHGRTGPREFLYGSIAQQVVAHGEVPVLLVRPGPPPPADLLSGPIVAPLDAEPPHARALPTAVELARPFGVSLWLVMVVPTTSTLAGAEAATARLLPSATRAVLDIDQESAEAYLRERAAELRSSNVEVDVEVLRGDPPAEIVRMAERTSAGLIVMGVHGALGTRAFWDRSVPPKVSGHTSIPVLLIPIRER
jgi:nucleotide-binding universal stress UspA family protein